LLSDYGATDPAEFFAVATEVFFEQPAHLARDHAALYAELRSFYGIDPLSW
jgi:Mlc titration factor MtfA (ptsG expression regulator)